MIAHQINPLLFNAPIILFRDGIVRGAADTSKREIRFETLKELLRHPRRIRRTSIHSKLRFLFGTQQGPLGQTRTHGGVTGIARVGSPMSIENIELECLK